MNEHELRLLVRAAVARHMGPASECESAQPAASHAPVQHLSSLAPSQAHHALYTGLVNISDTCVIEPAVSCDHCGYCKSHGF